MTDVGLVEAPVVVTLPDDPLLDAVGLAMVVLDATLLVDVALLEVELLDVELLSAAQLVKFWPPNNFPTVDASVK